MRSMHSIQPLARLIAILWLANLAGMPSPVMLYADELPKGVKNTQNPADIPLSPQESLQRIEVPDGFHVTLFAGEPDVRRPIAIDFDDRGRLWVAENYSHPTWTNDQQVDRILILDDTDHDGRFDERKIFWQGGRFVTGMAVGHGGVWIANSPELSFIPDRNGDLVPDSEPIVLLDGWSMRNRNNVPNNFCWGPDGWLYGAVGVGADSHVGKPGTPPDQRTRISRGIWRYHPIRHTFEVVAQGMVNPWGLDFNEFGDLLTSNTVIAHLWHIVPGAYYQRRTGERDHRFAYGRIQSIADHLHWGGGSWGDSRGGQGRHSVAGGGHAHCGAMVYLGDNWPDRYRGTFFTANLHGNRINNDRLVPHGSTYVGTHAEDFMLAHDPWFRGLSLKYGPDGAVYVTDWHDFGECHDTDGSHRTSGRIFKISYGLPNSSGQQIALGKRTSVELADLHLHANEWYVRHARRLLHERATADHDMHLACDRLLEIFAHDANQIHKLRAMWTLFVIGHYDEADLLRLLDHDNEHIRRWAVRLLVDDGPPGSSALDRLVTQADRDPSPRVRLAIASALGRLPLDRRWPVAGALLGHGDDAHDHFLPLMIWYGVEPLVEHDTPRALELTAEAKIPLVRRHIARRAVDAGPARLDQVVSFALQNPDNELRHHLLQGVLTALQDTGPHTAPESWQRLQQEVMASPDEMLRSECARLAAIFGDERAITELRQSVMDETVPSDERRAALAALMRLDRAIPVSMLYELVLGKSDLRAPAIRALATRGDTTTAQLLLGAYPRLTPAEKQDAIAVLVGHRESAAELLAAVEHGLVNRDDISVFALQQLRTFRAPQIEELVARLWQDDREKLDKSARIAHYKERLTPKYLASADAAAGRLLFERTCAACHTLFGEGGTLGPDLTGSQRADLDYVLQNLVDPSAVVDSAYRLTVVQTDAGRIVTGYLTEHGEAHIGLRTTQGRCTIPLDEIEHIETTSKSIMPDGMLDQFTDDQLRDLVAYLASSEQVEAP